MECVSELHIPIAIIGWDRMRLPTTRKTPLTGDVKTVAAPNVMEIASFQVMDLYVMLDSDNLMVTILPWETCHRRQGVEERSLCRKRLMNSLTSV